MKKQLLFVFVGVLASITILGISLLKTAHAKAASFTQPASTNKRFYLGQELKPDHVLFPLVGASDQVKMAVAAPEKQVNLSLAYTQKRIEYVRYLIDSSQPEMAVMSLMRGHQRLQQTVGLVLSLDDRDLKERVYNELIFYQDQITQIQGELGSEYLQVFEQMLQENQVSQQQLTSSQN